MFVKTSLRDQLVVWPTLDCVVMTFLAVFFLLQLPNCFLKVCLPTLFAAVLKYFLPLTISAFSGVADSNKSAPTRFAAGTIYILKNGVVVVAKLVHFQQIPVQVVDQYI